MKTISFLSKSARFYGIAVMALPLVSLAHTHAKFPMTAIEKSRTDISKVFDASQVGEEPTRFIDPIATCEARSAAKAADGKSVDCHSFQMGSPKDDPGKDGDEPQHQVRLTKNFEIQATDVTQLQWLMVMNGTAKTAPSEFTSDCDNNLSATYRVTKQDSEIETVNICKNHPVENISFNDIAGENGFLARLNASQTQYTYRLPTEAEWEYSARGNEIKADGSYPRYSFGDDAKDLDLYGWYLIHDDAMVAGNSDSRTHAVAQKKPNGFGLFDMHGNVWQLVQDFYESDYGLTQEKLAGISVDPVATPEAGDHHAVRGGSWNDTAYNLRTSFRYGMWSRSNDIGFRLVRTPVAH